MIYASLKALAGVALVLNSADAFLPATTTVKRKQVSTIHPPKFVLSTLSAASNTALR